MYAIGEVGGCLSCREKVQDVVKLPTVELQGEEGREKELPFVPVEDRCLKTSGISSCGGEHLLSSVNRRRRNIMGKQHNPKTPSEPVHVPGVRAGEAIVREEGKEPGRYDTAMHATGRRSGKRDLKKDKSVGFQAPIDPSSPHLQTP
jgi:hypothetical protein